MSVYGPSEKELRLHEEDLKKQQVALRREKEHNQRQEEYARKLGFRYAVTARWSWNNGRRGDLSFKSRWDGEAVLQIWDREAGKWIEPPRIFEYPVNPMDMPELEERALREGLKKIIK